MKSYIFKLSIIGRILCVFLLSLIFPQMSVLGQTTKYNKMVSQYHKTWEDLIPTHLKIQFAGNMGFMSFGTGWNYGNKHKWETDVFVGFIPKFDSKKIKQP